MVKQTNSNIKKKRKVESEKDTQTDLYKKVVDFEENEALKRNGPHDAQLYFDLCQEIRCMLQQIHSQKSNEAPKDKEVMKELQTEIFIKLCIIKKLNRIDKLRHVLEKETLFTEKQKCDSIKLNYQNLVYELQHLAADVKKCLAFKSKDEDIDLVSFEEFMKEAPESLTAKFHDYNPDDTEQAHNLRLTRLEWELAQRKNLAQLCNSLLEQHKKLEKDLVGHREKLSALGPLLDNIVKATHPLQEHLDISVKELRAEHHLAPLLPDPLYIFYVHITAYKNVHGVNLDVELLGNESEAVQWKEAAELSDHQNEEESEPEPDTQEIEVKTKKRRHRKSVAVEVVDPMEEKKKKLLEPHPLSVKVTATLGDGLSLSMTLRYHDKLKIVTVMSTVNFPTSVTANTAREILCGESVLSCLSEEDNEGEDDGRVCPNAAASYHLKRTGFPSYGPLVARIGYAYRWAQRICGVDFLTKQVNRNKLANANVEIVVNSLFKHLQARYNLAKQMELLEQNIIPEVPKSLELPSTFVSVPSKWSSATYQQFCQAEFTLHHVDEDLVCPSDMFYFLKIARDNAVLEAYVVIKKNYPEVSPIFALCLRYEKNAFHALNCGEIRDVERVINLTWQGAKQKESPWLLAAQVTYLCACLDVYLETTYPSKFPQKTSLIWNCSGKNRKRPLRYKKMGTGIFIQY